MNTKLINKAFRNKHNIAVIRYIVLSFTAFSIGFILMKFPESSFSGVTDGLEMSLKILIPSLYPFLVFSSFLINSEITVYLFRPLKKLADIIFSLPEQVFTVFILSVVGGFPIGPQMIKQLYEKGEISRLQGKRMLLFCMNPSPAFTISTVGYAFLKSEVLGTVIFFSIVLASLIAGMVQKLIKSDNYDLLKSQPEKESNISISQLLTESVKSSIGSMLMICAWVILFSCIIKITDITVDNMNIKNFIFAISEVTTGCRALSQKISVPAVAGIISFGGLCTHLQVMPCILKLKLKYKYFLISRIIISSLSTVICQVLLNIIPEAVQTISIGDRPVYSDYSVSLGVTVSVIIMSLLLLIGDNHIIKIKKYGRH